MFNLESLCLSVLNPASMVPANPHDSQNCVVQYSHYRLQAFFFTTFFLQLFKDEILDIFSDRFAIIFLGFLNERP